MATELKLPLLGDVMTEGTVAAWLKPDGALVERGEPVYQLETDKVSYAVEAPAAGILRHVVAEGSVVPVGAVVARLESGSGSESRSGQASDAAEPPGSATGAVGESASSRQSSAGGVSGSQRSLDIRPVGLDESAGVEGRVETERSRAAASEAKGAAGAERSLDVRHEGLAGESARSRLSSDRGVAGPQHSQGAQTGAEGAAGRAGGSAGQDVRASPAARRAARELGVDLAALGTERRIREADVRAFAEATGGVRLPSESHITHEPVRAELAKGPAPAGGRMDELAHEPVRPEPVGERTGYLTHKPVRPEPVEGRTGQLAHGRQNGGSVAATPAARRLARAHGIRLEELPDARLVREQDVQAFVLRQAQDERMAEDIRDERDVQAFVLRQAQDERMAEDIRDVRDTQAQDEGMAENVPDVRDTRAQDERKVQQAQDGRESAAGTRLSGRRRVIAERMTASLREMAQLTVSLEADMTQALALREQLKALWGDAAPTITDLVSRAAILALNQHPRLNATLEDELVVEHAAVHLGVAVDTEDGLIVPVVRHAHTLTLRELAAESRAQASAARGNKLQLGDLQGGTFTVTTLGQLGIDFFTPIVNPPQVAILGVGRVFSKLALDGATVRERSAMYLNLSFDHRAVDGAPAARFLNEVKRQLELPAALIV